MRFQLARDVVAELPRGARLAAQDLLEALGGGFTAKRQPAGQAAIEDDADRPDVGPPVQAVGLAAHLLGSHVRKRAGHLAPPQPLNLLVHGQPEVADLGPALEVEQDVGRLQVAMDQPRRVRMVHGLGHRRHDAGQAERLEPARREAPRAASAPRRTRARGSRRRAPLRRPLPRGATNSWTLTIPG